MGVRGPGDSMGPLGTPWDHLGPLGTTWDPLGPVGTPWDPLGPLGTTWDHLGPRILKGLRTGGPPSGGKKSEKRHLFSQGSNFPDFKKITSRGSSLRGQQKSEKNITCFSRGPFVFFSNTFCLSLGIETFPFNFHFSLDLNYFTAAM